MLIQVFDHMESRNPLRQFHKGIVLDNDDPKRIGRVKAFVHGILQGDKEVLPWCVPVLPSLGGSAPDSLSFNVPEIGSEIEVSFLSDNVLTPVYRGSWTSEAVGVPQIFGENYPFTRGSVDSTGSISRTNLLKHSREFFHSSHMMSRINNNGDLDLSVPGDLQIRVDGRLSVNQNYWANGGGGMGNIIEELMYAMVEGPVLRGLIDIASALPVDVSIRDFYNDCVNLRTFAGSLTTLDPEMTNLKEKLDLIPNKDRIQRTFASLNRVEGLSNLLYSFFGLFGSWSSIWLQGSQDLLNGVILGLNSQTVIKNILLGSVEDLEEILGYPIGEQHRNFLSEEEAEAQSELTGRIIEKLVIGFNALTQAMVMMRYAEDLRDVITDRDYSWTPRRLFAAMPVELKEYVETRIRNLYQELVKAVDPIDFNTQIVFLDRFGLAEYFALPNASVEKIKWVVDELIGTGVNPYELGLYGNVVGFAMTQDLIADNESRNFLLESAQALGIDIEELKIILGKNDFDDHFPPENRPDRDDDTKEKKYETTLTRAVLSLSSIGCYKDKIMEVLDAMRFDVPIAIYAEEDEDGILTRKVLYLDPVNVESFVDGLANLADDADSKGSQIGLGDEDGFVDPEDIGEGTPGQGTIISGDFVSYMGEAIGAYARATVYKVQAETFLGKEFADYLNRKETDFANEDESVEDDRLGNLVYVFNEAYNWFTKSVINDISPRLNNRTIAKELNSFLLGLDPVGLYENLINTQEIFYFVRRLSEIARPRAIQAYGGNLYQILSSGFAPLMFEDLSTRLKNIEELVYKRLPDYEPQPPWYETSESLSEGPYFPKTYWYSLIFGSPNPKNSQGQNALNKRSRELGVLSNRVKRLGTLFRDANIQYIKNDNAANNTVVEIEDIPGLAELRARSQGNEQQ